MHEPDRSYLHQDQGPLPLKLWAEGDNKGRQSEALASAAVSKAGDPSQRSEQLHGPQDWA